MLSPKAEGMRKDLLLEADLDRPNALVLTSPLHQALSTKPIAFHDFATDAKAIPRGICSFVARDACRTDTFAQGFVTFRKSKIVGKG